MLNELDQKSEWRKELMNIAAKPVMQLEDVYRILASLRFLPKSKDEIEGEESEKRKSKKAQMNTKMSKKVQMNTKKHKTKNNQTKKEKKYKKVLVIEKMAQIKKNLTLYLITFIKKI